MRFLVRTVGVLWILLIPSGCGTANQNMEARISSAMKSGDSNKIENAVIENIDKLPRWHSSKLLDEACKSGNVAGVTTLLNHNISPSRSALYFAAQSGNIEICQKLIEAGCEIDEVDRETGQAGLFGAIGNGNPEVFNYFMKMKSRTDIADLSGSTPLLYAAIMKNSYAFSALLNHQSVNIDAQDMLGNTALIYCSLTNNLDFVKLLVARNVDYNIRNNDNRTALEIALNCYSYEAAHILVENGVDLPKDQNYNSEAEKSYFNGVFTLLRKDQDTSSLNNALLNINNAKECYSNEYNNIKKAISKENASYVALTILDFALDVLAQAGDKGNTTTYKYSTPGGVYSQSFTTYNYQSDTFDLNFAGKEKHTAIIKQLSYRKVFLNRRIGICNLILDAGGVANITPEQRAATIKSVDGDMKISTE